MSEDPTDINALTPGHFLIGEALMSPPEQTEMDMKTHTWNRWKHIQKMKRDFWNTWQKEYLQTLQQRPKWTHIKENIKEGDLVLVKDENLPPAKWALARVIETHKGSDGLIRVVTLKSKSNTTLKRPITKICKLPIHAEDNSNSEPTTSKITSYHVTSTKNAHSKVNYDTVSRKRSMKGDSTPIKKKLKIHPVSGYSNLILPKKADKRKLHSEAENSNENNHKVPTSSQNTVPNIKRLRRISITQYKMRNILLLLLLLVAFKLGRCSYIVHPKPGIYIEHIGEAQIKRGTFKLEVTYSWEKMKKDKENSIKVLEQMTDLCNKTLKISKETHCDGLIHYLEERTTEILQDIETLHNEYTRKRQRRGFLGSMLEMIFGVHDKIYVNLDKLDHNQKILMQAANQQTNIMLSTLAITNETEARTIKRLNKFGAKLNMALETIKEIQAQWFSGPDVNKINIHLLASYHTADNYLIELLQKYRKIMKAYFNQGNILELITPAKLITLLNEAKERLPTNLHILRTYKCKTDIQFDEEYVRIYGLLHIIELNKYSIIMPTPIPQRTEDGVYKILDIPAQFLAINYNDQLYFSLREQELRDCIKLDQYEYLCTPTVVQRIDESPNCIIDEIYRRPIDKNCPVAEVKTTELVWKHLYMSNTWMYMTTNPSIAALKCNGTRQDIMLKDVGIIQIPQECIIQTKRNILKPEITLKIPVKASFIKPVAINSSLIITSNKIDITKLQEEPVLKPSESVYSKLANSVHQYRGHQTEHEIHNHLIGTSIFVITALIIGVSYYGLRRLWLRTQQQRERPSTNNDSEFELRTFSRSQNVQ